MNIKEQINLIISELGITKVKASEVMEISYNTLRQKNSEKSTRHSWNQQNLDKLILFKNKYEQIFLT